jgi:hypothetical protein
MIESAIKADGRGLNIPFDRIGTDLDKGSVIIDGDTWMIRDINLDCEHYCYVASVIEDSIINCIFADFY